MSYLRRTRLWRASLSPTADPTAGHRAPRRSSWPRSTGSSACEASRAPVASFRITRPLSMPPPDVRVVLNADEAARSAASARDRSRWSARNRVPDARPRLPTRGEHPAAGQSAVGEARFSSSIISTVSGHPATAPPDCSLVIQTHVPPRLPHSRCGRASVVWVTSRPLRDRLGEPEPPSQTATPLAGRFPVALAPAFAGGSGRLVRGVADARSGRHASAPSGRVPTTATAGESERTPAATVERLVIVLSVAERTPPPPGRPSGHARPVRGRRAADAGRHAIRLLDIGVLPEAPWSSSTSSRRPVEPGATT